MNGVAGSLWNSEQEKTNLVSFRSELAWVGGDVNDDGGGACCERGNLDELSREKNVLERKTTNINIEK